MGTVSQASDTTKKVSRATSAYKQEDGSKHPGHSALRPLSLL